MKAIEFYRMMCDIIPTCLSCEWDHDGLEVCPNPEKQVNKVLISLDVTDDVIDYAVSEGFDVIISHHPIFFGSLDRVDATEIKGSRAVKLVKNDIAVMSFHTRLDALEGGVNDTLARILGLHDIKTVEADNDMIMRIGTLECECDAEVYCSRVKAALSTDLGQASVTLAPSGRNVKTVALIGGSGGDYVWMAAKVGADTYVTGDVKYHQYLSAKEFNINIITAGHFHTEYPVCQMVSQKLAELCPEIQTKVYDSNRLKTF